MQHNGECEYCGTSVRVGFNTCPSCGATFGQGVSVGSAIILIFFVGPLLAYCFWVLQVGPGTVQNPVPTIFEKPIFVVVPSLIWAIIAGLAWFGVRYYGWFKGDKRR
jgi:hypothetical protein